MHNNIIIVILLIIITCNKIQYNILSYIILLYLLAVAVEGSFLPLARCTREDPHEGFLKGGLLIRHSSHNFKEQPLQPRGEQLLHLTSPS